MDLLLTGLVAFSIAIAAFAVGATGSRHGHKH